MDAGKTVKLVGVVTKGQDNSNRWVRTYRVKTSTDGSTWSSVENGKTFNGNTDRNTQVAAEFDTPVTARYVRIYPQTWQGMPAMRAGLYVDTAKSICPSGKYGSEQNKSVSQCKTCPAGRAALAKSTHCTTCPFNTFMSTTGQAACIWCPAGKYTKQAGSKLASNCAGCPVGKIGTSAGTCDNPSKMLLAAKWQKQKESHCALTKYQKEYPTIYAAKKVCVKLGEHACSGINDERCDGRANHKDNKSTKGFALCMPVGIWNPAGGNNGYTVSKKLTASATVVVIIFFIPISRTVTKTIKEASCVYNFPRSKCKPGFYGEPNAAGPKCITCAAGQYTFYPGSTSCQTCPFGRYSAPGSGQCTYCKPGSSTTSDGRAANQQGCSHVRQVPELHRRHEHGQDQVHQVRGWQGAGGQGQAEQE